MRYFLHLAYNGTNYHGWQRQAQVSSVQATIEDKMRIMLSSDLTIHGCGRTDTGVHASSYYAHFKIEEKIDFDLVYKLNRMLPDDIVIYDLIEVGEKANAQLDAKDRTYEYRVHLKKDPFLVNKSACYDMIDMDLDKMKQACVLFSKYEDFKYFCLQPELHNHTLCDLREVSMTLNESKDRILFRFRANRFLRGMIRISVGRILDVGRGQVSLDELELSLSGKQENRYMTQAYPQGLYLTDVVYDYI